MKKVYVNIVLLVLTAASSGAQLTAGAMRQRLDNEGVIEMVRAGLSEDVIISKIRAIATAEPASLALDTSVEGLKKLKDLNVSDSLLRVMISPSAFSDPTVGPTAITTDANLPPAEVGVYWKNSGKFEFIQGQTISHAKVGGKAGSFVTYGMRGVHWDAFLNGAKSRNVIKDSQPVFYFYVPEGLSAADFVLMKLNQKSGRREFQIGSFGGMHGGQAGIKHDKEFPFKAEHVGIRTYRIMPDQGLKPGEYGFFMGTGAQTSTTTAAGAKGGAGSGGAATGRMYDFTIPG